MKIDCFWHVLFFDVKYETLQGLLAEDHIDWGWQSDLFGCLTILKKTKNSQNCFVLPLLNTSTNLKETWYMATLPQVAHDFADRFVIFAFLISFALCIYVVAVWRHHCAKPFVKYVLGFDNLQWLKNPNMRMVSLSQAAVLWGRRRSIRIMWEVKEDDISVLSQ